MFVGLILLFIKIRKSRFQKKFSKYETLEFREAYFKRNNNLGFPKPPQILGKGTLKGEVHILSVGIEWSSPWIP